MTIRRPAPYRELEKLRIKAIWLSEYGNYNAEFFKWHSETIACLRAALSADDELYLSFRNLLFAWPSSLIGAIRQFAETSVGAGEIPDSLPSEARDLLHRFAHQIALHRANPKVVSRSLEDDITAMQRDRFQDDMRDAHDILDAILARFT